eukprot:1112820-Prorocentrum_minimum.AAC.1
MFVGQVNYVAVTEALQVPPSLNAAGLAADNLICALYFTTVFAIAAAANRKEKEEKEREGTSNGDAEGAAAGSGGEEVDQLETGSKGNINVRS